MSYQKVNHDTTVEYEMEGSTHQRPLPEASAARPRLSRSWPPSLFWHIFVLIVPMMAMAVALLVLVSHYRVYDQSGNSLLPVVDQRVDSHAIYIRFSATQLVFIASFASTLAAVLSGSILYFLSYPASQQMLKASATDQAWNLPTPSQLVLTLSMLTGNAWSSLWFLIRYSWNDRRTKGAPPLRVMTTGLVIAFLMSIFVFATDAWLHVTTKSTLLTQIQPFTTNIPNYSFDLTPLCTDSSIPNNVTALRSCIGQAGFPINSSVQMAVLGNVSATTIGATYLAAKDSDPYVYLGIPDAFRESSLDYRATTYGLQTHCTPVSRKCNLQMVDEADNNFACTPAFSGAFGTGQTNITHFKTSAYDAIFNSSDGSIQNPYYFGWATADLNSAQANHSGQPEFVTSGHGGLSIILECNTQVFDVTYDSVNSSITSFNTIASNDSVTNIMRSIIAGTSVWDGYMKYATQIAGFQLTAQGVADQLALAYSKQAISNFAMGTQSAPTLLASTRQQIIVAQIPPAAFYTFLTSILLYVAVGLILVVVALQTTTPEGREARASISIRGMVHQLFEETSPDPKYARSSLLLDNGGARIGLAQSDAGHGYVLKAVGR